MEVGLATRNPKEVEEIQRLFYGAPLSILPRFLDGRGPAQGLRDEGGARITAWR